MFFVGRWRDIFCHDVAVLKFSIDETNKTNAFFDVLTNLVVANIDVFRANTAACIFSKVNCAHVVNVEDNG